MLNAQKPLLKFLVTKDKKSHPIRKVLVLPTAIKIAKNNIQKTVWQHLLIRTFMAKNQICHSAHSG